MFDKLQNLGLSLQEARIYVALLEIGPSKVGEILKKTHINRAHIYDRLEKLIGKGLVSSMKRNKKKYFLAANPNALKILLDTREKEISEQKIHLNGLIKVLEKVPLEHVNESVELYEGKQGIKNILDDIIRTHSEILTYGSEGNFKRVLTYHFKHYLKALEKNKIPMKIIFSKDANRHILKWNFDVRYIPKIYDTPTETTIYGDKVAIFILTNNPKAILIKSKATSESYRKYFHLMWKVAQK